MSLSITDLKKGTLFVLDGEPFRVVEYNQKVVGRGGSIVSVRIKSLLDGHVVERTFKGNEQIDSADVSLRPAQFLYSDVENAFFMDDESFEQFSIPTSDVEDKLGFLREGDKVSVQLFNDSPISVELANSVILKIEYTEDVVRGDTATNILKDATVETGLAIKVPPFIKIGDNVKVDTRTSQYIERVK